jgi:hypothetical protein
VAITGGPARSGHTAHAATLPDQEAQRWAPPLRCTLGLSVRITLLDSDVPSYFQSLEHLLRYCARPPFALERLSVIRACEKPSRHSRSATSASNARPRPVGMGTTVARRGAAVTRIRITSPARTTPRGLRGRN